MHGRMSDTIPTGRAGALHHDFPSTLNRIPAGNVDRVQPLTQRLESITKDAECIRARLAEVLTRVGGDPFDVSVTECPPRGVGLHGQVDELAQTMLFLTNITDTLTCRV